MPRRTKKKPAVFQFRANEAGNETHQKPATDDADTPSYFAVPGTQGMSSRDRTIMYAYIQDGTPMPWMGVEPAEVLEHWRKRKEYLPFGYIVDLQLVRPISGGSWAEVQCVSQFAIEDGRILRFRAPGAPMSVTAYRHALAPGRKCGRCLQHWDARGVARYGRHIHTPSAKLALRVDNAIYANAPPCYDPRLLAIKAGVAGKAKAILHREAWILTYLRTQKKVLKHIVFFYGWWSTHDRIVMEYIPCTLAQLVRPGGLNKPRALRRVFYNLVSGLAFLHDAYIIHGDIHPSNILARDTDGTIKLLYCDFSSARAEAPTVLAVNIPYQREHMAPEQLLSPTFHPTKHGDIYTLAMTILFAANGGPPFRQPSNYSAVAAQAVTGCSVFFTGELKKRVARAGLGIQLIHMLRYTQPTTRPTAKELLVRRYKPRP